MKKLLIIVLCVVLNGCAEYESKSFDKAVSSDEAHVRQWFTNKKTTPEAIIGKSKNEVERTLGKSSRKYLIPSVLFCEKQLRDTGREPKACTYKKEVWSYNIPVYWYLMGNSGTDIYFLNDEVVIVEGGWKLRIQKEGYKEIED